MPDKLTWSKENFALVIKQILDIAVTSGQDSYRQNLLDFDKGKAEIASRIETSENWDAMIVRFVTELPQDEHFEENEVPDEILIRLPDIGEHFEVECTQHSTRPTFY